MAEKARRFRRMFPWTGLCRRSCAGLWLLSAALASACAGAHGAAPAAPESGARPLKAQASAEAAPTPSEPPRLFPPLDSSETLLAGEERDGSERLVAYGLRVLSRPDGRARAGSRVPAVRPHRPDLGAADAAGAEGFYFTCSRRARRCCSEPRLSRATSSPSRASNSKPSR